HAADTGNPGISRGRITSDAKRNERPPNASASALIRETWVETSVRLIAATALYECDALRCRRHRASRAHPPGRRADEPARSAADRAPARRHAGPCPARSG